MARTALVVGATGLVGGNVLDLLLADDRCSRVIVLVRRPVGRTHDKLREQIVDFEKLAPSLDGVNDVFACLGTTIKAAGSKERFRRVDHDYTLEVARLAHAAGAHRLALVSSVGASERASSFYLRVKGETERELRKLRYERLVIAQPSFLVGERTESRPAESAGIAVASLFAPLLLAGLRAYRPIAARDVASALIDALLATDGPDRAAARGQREHAEGERERARAGSPAPEADAEEKILTYSQLVAGKHA